MLSRILRLFAFGASILVSSIPMPAFAQASAHWSTFNKQASACACHLFSRDALRKEGLKILEDGDSGFVAQGENSIAHVYCKPGGQQVFVIAFSPISTVAEKLRNDVRETIVKSVLFDTCP